MASGTPFAVPFVFLALIAALQCIINTNVETSSRHLNLNALNLRKYSLSSFDSSADQRYINYRRNSHGVTIVDVRENTVNTVFIDPLVKRLLEITDVPIELWVSKMARDALSEHFEELDNNTERLCIRTMPDNITRASDSVSLQSAMGGYIGKAYALKESQFDIPILLDGDVWPCNSRFMKDLNQFIINGTADVVWTSAPIPFGGAPKDFFVDPRIQNQLESYQTFGERNTGTILAVRRTNPLVQEWLALTLDIYVQHIKGSVKLGNGGHTDQPAFREAFFIYRNQLKEHLVHEKRACRMGVPIKSGCGCYNTQCSLIHDRWHFRNCSSDWSKKKVNSLF